MGGSAGGIYQALSDHEHYVGAGALDDWFDVVLQVREISSTRLLC